MFVGIASAVVTSFYGMLAFVSTKTFKYLADCLGWAGCYWLFAFICIGGAVFTFFVVPETRGKSSEEIQLYFGAETISVTSDTSIEEEQRFLKKANYEVDVDNNVSLNLNLPENV
jgi:hypothetical protein